MITINIKINIIGLYRYQSILNINSGKQTLYMKIVKIDGEWGIVKNDQVNPDHICLLLGLL